jgi:hypothetical protein
MFCTKCGNPLGAHDQFCGRCGVAVNGNGNDDTEREDAKRYPSALRNPEGGAAVGLPAGAREKFDSLVATQTRKALYVSGPIGAFGLLGLAGGAVPVGLIFLTIAGLVYRRLARDAHLTHAEYFGLEGSSTPAGAPRCVCCGHIGIYAHGKYRSRHTYHDCRKCGTTLYMTRKI